MGNEEFWSSWTPSQRLFALVWPGLILYAIMKLLVEKRWYGAVRPDPEIGMDNLDNEDPTRKDPNDPYAFKFFRTFSDPAALLEGSRASDLERIVSQDRTEAGIKATFERILDLPLLSLSEELQNNTINAFTVLCAYVWRASKINKEIKCITEFIREAFSNARSVDDRYFQTDVPKKPLYGIPFSVKSNFNMQHRTVTLGLKNWEKKPPAEKDCSMVEFLKSQGAIPFCLTNVPQGLLSYVSSNPLYGTTKNPWNFERTPGGSSGGEGALVSAGGSPFGIGSDLAGSLRIPAAFCGLVTLKPGQERLVVTGTQGGLPGKGRLGLSFGFYTRTVGEQEFLLRLIVGSPEYRAICPQSIPSPLVPLDANPTKIGWFVDDGFNKVLPSNKRAVEEICAKLRQRRVDVVEFRMSEVERLFQHPAQAHEFKLANIFFRNVMPDNGEHTSSLYSGEANDPYMKWFTRMLWFKVCLPGRFTNAAANLAKHVSPRAAALGYARNSGVGAVRENQEMTDIFKEKWIDYWKSLQIDALICPSFITPAQQFRYPAFLSGGTFLTGLFNMLDVPAGIVPYDLVTEEDVANVRNPEVYSVDEDKMFQYQRKVGTGSSGLPNAVQVVTLPFEEEMCLKAMALVEELSPGVPRLKWILPDGERAAGANEPTSADCFSRIAAPVPAAQAPAAQAPAAQAPAAQVPAAQVPAAE